MTGPLNQARYLQVVKRLSRKISGGVRVGVGRWKKNVRDNSMIRCGAWGKQSWFRVRFSGGGWWGHPAGEFLWYDEVSGNTVAVVVDVFACSCVSRVREFRMFPRALRVSESACFASYIACLLGAAWSSRRRG